MPAGRVKFAVVREDPELEAHLVARLQAKAVVLVASGGCTALTLARLHPSLTIAAFDLNPAQLAHIDEKLAAVEAGDLGALNVEHDHPHGLNQRGAFEGLFRVLRQFIEEFVATPEEIASFFTSDLHESERADCARRWITTNYWPAAFSTVFNEPFLIAMFGPNAVQHAQRGSYPAYFQAAFERGLSRPSPHRNPFLQHVLLGRYLAADAPPYTRGGRLPRPELIAGSLVDVPDLARFQLFSLSNVFDWSGDALVQEWAALLKRHAAPGSAVLIRQLNNHRELRQFFQPDFAFDDDLGRDLLARDRSLFYQRIEVGFRT